MSTESAARLAARYLRFQRELTGPDLVLPPRAPAAEAESLEMLAARTAACRGCGPAPAGRPPVFGEGPPRARLMLVGDGPSEEDERTGRPFDGEAGELLGKILAAIGFERDEVYLATALKCRRPGGREPSAAERRRCLPVLARQIALVRPDVLLLMGREAALALLGEGAPVEDLRGRVHDAGGVPALVTFPPAALLGNPGLKARVWEDVQRLRRLYDERVGDKPAWTPPNAKR